MVSASNLEVLVEYLAYGHNKVFKLLEKSAYNDVVFLFYIWVIYHVTNIHDSQNSSERGRLSLKLLLFASQALRH